MMPTIEHPDVIVIGAGLHGSSAALHLAMAKCRVLLLDHGSGGRHSSKVSAGGLRQLMREEAEIPLAIEALKMWHEIEKLVDDHCGVGFGGQIFIAENSSELEILQARQKRMINLGYDHEELIDQHEARKLMPHISEKCIGGLICRSDGFGSPFRSTFAFQNKAESLGVEFLRNSPVSSIKRVRNLWHVHTPDGREFKAPTVINCAGAWGDKIASMVGDAIPISAESPMMMITPPIAPFLTPVVITTGRKLSFKQAPNGIVLIGGGHRGTLDRETGETHIDFSRLQLSASTVIDLFPHMADVPIVRAWGGIEGLTPDKIPVLSKSDQAENFFHSFGYSSHGYLLAPVVGKLIAEMIVDGKPSISVDAFNMTRFTNVEKFDKRVAR